MKKIILIFSTLLSVFVLNSCKDDETTNNGTSNNSVITFLEIKSYVGKTPGQVAAIIKPKGFTFLSSEHEQDKGYHQTYKGSDEKTFIEIWEADDNVDIVEGVTCYVNGVNGEREKIINQFSLWLSEITSLVSSNPNAFNYSEGYVCNDEEGNERYKYFNHADFLIGFNQNKNNIYYCGEQWKDMEINFETGPSDDFGGKYYVEIVSMYSTTNKNYQSKNRNNEEY